MTRPEWVMAGVALTSPLLVGILGLAGDDSLTWHASPPAWPTFNPLVAIALLPLLAPLARIPKAAPVLAEDRDTTRGADLVPAVGP
jgi:hypothetical protein